MVSGTETRISVAYDDSGGNLNYVVDDMTFNPTSLFEHPEVTVTATDKFCYGDVTDNGDIKHDTIQGILDLVSGGGGSGTVNTGGIHEVAYYSANGTTLDGDPGLMYEATGHTLTGTAQWTTTSMLLSGTGGLEIDVASGDPVIIFDTAGADKFTMGVDDSDADSFKINSGGSLGTTSDFRMDSSGNVMIQGELNAASLDISGNVDVDGNLETDAFSINGTSVTSTAAELNLIDGGTARGTVAVASGDGFLHNDGGVMRMTNISALADRLAGTNLTATDGVIAVSAAGGDEWGDPVDADIVPDGITGRNLGTAIREFNDLFLTGTATVDAIVNSGTTQLDGDVTFGGNLVVGQSTTWTPPNPGSSYIGTSTNYINQIHSNTYVAYDNLGNARTGTSTDSNGITHAAFSQNIVFKFQDGICYHIETLASDETIKDNIQEISPSGLDLISQLKIKSWNWKEDYATAMGIETSTLIKGVVAQDVQSISEDYVQEITDPRDEDETILDLTPAFHKDIQLSLVQSLKELKAKNDALEARIATLEAA